MRHESDRSGEPTYVVLSTEFLGQRSGHYFAADGRRRCEVRLAGFAP